MPLLEVQKDPDQIMRGNLYIRQAIETALNARSGALIGRHGTIEFESILDSMNGHPLRTHVLQRNAGIFPASQPSTTQWLKEYWASSKQANILATGWYEPTSVLECNLVSKYNSNAKQIVLRALEPYYCPEAERWTHSLSGRKVTIVSSFTDTMKQQVNYLQEVWGSQRESILPSDAHLSFVRTYYPPSLTTGLTSWGDSIQTWKEAVDYLFESVMKQEPEIVLIGCGGLAMPLAKKLKEANVVAVVLGGAVQNLFGIKGQRWEKHDVISKFWNDAWVYPSINETPDHAVAVEGGCYWSPLSTVLAGSTLPQLLHEVSLPGTPMQ